MSLCGGGLILGSVTWEHTASRNSGCNSWITTAKLRDTLTRISAQIRAPRPHAQVVPTCWGSDGRCVRSWDLVASAKFCRVDRAGPCREVRVLFHQQCMSLDAP